MTTSQAQAINVPPSVKPTSPTPVKRTRPRKKPAKRVSPTPSPEPVTLGITPEQIAERAYFVWLSKGRPVGQDEQNWTEAEAELSHSPNPSDR